MRFPEFKGEWRYSSLGRECDILCGYPFDGQAILEKSGNVKLLRGINITEGEIRHSDELDRYYSGDILKLKKYILCEGDLVLSMDGSKVGRNSAILTNLEDGAYLVQRICRIRSQKHDVKYIFQHINNSRFHQYVDSVKTASAIPHISQSDIQNYIIPFPPTHEEQIKITNLLSLLDEHIATQSKIIEKYESLIKGIGNKLFSFKMRFKTNDGNDFPSWKTKSFENIGKTFSGLSGKAKEDFGIGKPYIQYKQVFDSPQIQIQNCGLVNVSDSENQNNVKYGDILFTVSSETPNEIGMSSVLLDEVDEMYLNSFCFGYRLSSFEVLSPLYASYFFRDSSFRNKVVKIAQGSTRYNISKSELIKLEISLPSIEEQARIASFLSAVDEKIKNEKEILDLYLIQKSYLLRQMFI